MTKGSAPGTVREVVSVFGRLGVIAFGGPVAHTAMMREELVRRRGWVSDERFLDLMGATNLIPGPNSTELAIHLGHERAGWRGLIGAGIAFILPAALIVTGLAWWYVEAGQTPGFQWLLFGVVPVVLGIIAHALIGLVRTVLGKHPTPGRVATTLLFGVALTAYFLGLNELLILASGAVLGVAAWAVRSHTSTGPTALILPLLIAVPEGRLPQLWWSMLKIGAVLYGSGYVLLAFLDAEFGQRLGWVSQQQLLDAISIGQVTPGPVFTTATFLGYLVAGPAGAFVATVAIFAPSFVFVGLLTKLTNWLRARGWTSFALDGINVTALALMSGVSVDLARTTLTGPIPGLLFAAAVATLLKWRGNSAWLVAGGAVAGVLAGVGGLI